MLKYPAYNPAEQEVIGTHPCGSLGMFRNMGMNFFPEVEPLYNRPITPKENLHLAFSGQKPYWIPFTGAIMCDVSKFAPRQLPDCFANRVVMDADGIPEYPSETAKGWFGLDWVFVPVAGGATVKSRLPN